MNFNAWPTGNGIRRRWSLVGDGVSFLEEVCHCLNRV